MKSININRWFSFENIVLLCLSFATMNMIGRHYLFIYAALLLFFLLLKGSIYPDFSLLLLFILAFSLAIFSPDSYQVSIFNVVKPFVYPIAYMIGYGLCKKQEKRTNSLLTEHFVLKVMIFLAVGALVHYILNWIYAPVSTDTRNTLDFWTGTALAATNQAAMACMALGIAIGCLISEAKWFYKIVATAIMIAILAYNLVLSGRSLLMMTILVLALALLHRIFNDKTKISNKIRFIIIIVVVAILLFVAYQLDWFGLKTTVEDSPLYDRFFGTHSEDVTEDGRMDNKIKYLNRIFDYPFGGLHIRPIAGYAHDIFLDTYDEAGWIALLAILIYIIVTLVNLFKCLKNPLFSFQFKQIVLCFYFISYIEFCIEPVFQASPWLFAAFCVTNGCINALINARQKHGSYIGEKNVSSAN